MSTKAARGTKRICEGCGAKFYDLNNDPVICPMCEVEFKVARPAEDKEKKIKEAEAAAEKAAAEKKAEAASKNAEIDPDVAAIDDEDLADIDDDDDDDSDDESNDTFLPDEDEGGNDVSEIIGDNKPKVEDEG